MCSPLPSDLAALLHQRPRIDFMWAGSTPVGDHLPRPPPVPAMHHEHLGKDSGTLTSLHLINQASVSTTADCIWRDVIFFSEDPRDVILSCLIFPA